MVETHDADCSRLSELDRVGRQDGHRGAGHAQLYPECGRRPHCNLSRPARLLAGTGGRLLNRWRGGGGTRRHCGRGTGRRRTLVTLSGLMALAGLVLVVSESFPVLLLAAFVGNLSGFVGGGGTGPLEQAILAVSVTPHRRTDLFALSSIAGTIAGALGALASGMPTLLQRAFGLGALASFRPMCVAYTLLAVLTALCYSRLSCRVEVARGEARWTNPFTLPSRGRIFTLAGLFTVDSFGTGLIVQSLASYWFFTRFGLQPGSLGALFFASNVLTAISLWVAARLAQRIGLLNTVVFTHIPASLFLIAVPFVPDAWMAMALWLLRAFFVQMDAPTSQSYTMAVVAPEEQTAMASA